MPTAAAGAAAAAATHAPTAAAQRADIRPAAADGTAAAQLPSMQGLPELPAVPLPPGIADAARLLHQVCQVSSNFTCAMLDVLAVSGRSP